jgi:hypothetical protein
MSRVPTCPILASGGAALKDAARRQRGGLKAVLDRGSADRRRDFRPGRRNAPVQPNEETSLAAMPPLLHTLTDTTSVSGLVLLLLLCELWCARCGLYR